MVATAPARTYRVLAGVVRLMPAVAVVVPPAAMAIVVAATAIIGTPAATAVVVPPAATAVVVSKAGVMAVEPVRVATPARIPEIAGAPLWERSGLSLGDASRSQTGQPQSCGYN